MCIVEGERITVVCEDYAGLRSRMNFDLSCRKQAGTVNPDFTNI